MRLPQKPALTREQATSFILPSLAAWSSSSASTASTLNGTTSSHNSAHLTITADIAYVEGSISRTQKPTPPTPNPNAHTLGTRRQSLFDSAGSRASTGGLRGSAGPRIAQAPSPAPVVRARDGAFAGEDIDSVPVLSYVFEEPQLKSAQAQNGANDADADGVDTRSRNLDHHLTNGTASSRTDGSTRRSDRLWVGRDNSRSGANGDAWVGVWEFSAAISELVPETG